MECTNIYDFISIDFETANNNNNSAISLGMCMVNGKEIVHQEYFLINPPTTHFRHENTEIHGITYDDVKNQPSFDKIWEKIGRFFNENILIIAHNAQFDMSVLKETLMHYNLDLPTFNYIDSISIARKFLQCTSNSLVSCAEAAGVDMTNHHNALSDAHTSAEIVKKCIEESKTSDISKMINKYCSLKRKIHSFSDLKSNKAFHSKKFENIKIGEISATTENFNELHPLYNKNCVVTGEFSFSSRKDILQSLVDIGANIKSSVSSRTNYLFVGVQDKRIVGEDGLSTKEEKAYKLIEEGKEITILRENDLIELLNK